MSDETVKAMAEQILEGLDKIDQHLVQVRAKVQQLLEARGTPK